MQTCVCVCLPSLCSLLFLQSAVQILQLFLQFLTQQFLNRGKTNHRSSVTLWSINYTLMSTHRPHLPLKLFTQWAKQMGWFQVKLLCFYIFSGKHTPLWQILITNMDPVSNKKLQPALNALFQTVFSTLGSVWCQQTWILLIWSSQVHSSGCDHGSSVYEGQPIETKSQSGWS